jgi:Flp pilus assembly protein TadG
MRTRPCNRGSVLVESVLILPIVLALLIGTVELARVTYTYYMLEKIMYNFARFIGTQQGVNFCDPNDASIQSAIAYAMTGAPDGSGTTLLPGLQANMFQVNAERVDATSGNVVACDCSTVGCDASQGGQPPSYIAVSLVDGYTVHPLFWGFSVDPFPLRPSVRLPYGGT